MPSTSYTHHYTPPRSGQVAAFREGFDAIFPLDCLAAFYEDEIEVMLCGACQMLWAWWRCACVCSHVMPCGRGRGAGGDGGACFVSTLLFVFCLQTAGRPGTYPCLT